MPKHFLDITDFSRVELREILDLGHSQKAFWSGKGSAPRGATPLSGRCIALIFEKPSTRTRFSFETAIHRLGGHVSTVTGDQMQLERGETLADTARVLSRYVDGIMIRTDSSAKLRDLAHHSTVPVINGLTDESHPCQIMADIMTLEEHFGTVKGLEIAWLGDGNNVCRSLVQASGKFGYNMRIGTPESLRLDQDTITTARASGAHIIETTDPEAAAKDADVIVTDTWVSMGDDNKDERLQLLAPYQVKMNIMGFAKDTAVFLHCLPAHRGEEVTDEVMDGPQSLIFDEAENRAHAQAGVLIWALAGAN